MAVRAGLVEVESGLMPWTAPAASAVAAVAAAVAAAGAASGPTRPYPGLLFHGSF